MVNTQAGKTARQIYEDLYKQASTGDLWFRWRGKPLMVCDPGASRCRAEGVLYTPPRPLAVHDCQHAVRLALDAYPQVYGYTDDPNRPEKSTSPSLRT